MTIPRPPSLPPAVRCPARDPAAEPLWRSATPSPLALASRCLPLCPLSEPSTRHSSLSSQAEVTLFQMYQTRDFPQLSAFPISLCPNPRHADGCHRRGIDAPTQGNCLISKDSRYQRHGR
ncbi:hypothetical protein CO2235_MP70254 [Cupriavidus oxalaticus]|uniref:Uncharacterized protein n=1 Tax=Cupriavidus oxalaticus TaxID=96344 RepID=A0A375GQ26_9BURK|nr:hypothetical protein CO2235_MP70254 [Cupriavidus oxalaticus]